MWKDQTARRDFLRLSGAGIAAALPYRAADAQTSPTGADSGVHDVRMFGAAGDGNTVDTPAINRAIDAAAAAGDLGHAEPHPSDLAQNGHRGIEHCAAHARGAAAVATAHRIVLIAHPNSITRSGLC